MRRLVLFVLLGGCHKLFGLDPVDINGVRDGGGDNNESTSAIDAFADAAPVRCPTPLVYDEDGDSIDDRCDACPTVASDSLDEDGDGLPNACDSNLANVDAILFAATFAQAVDLTAFSQSGLVWSPAAQGTVSFTKGASLRTTQSYQPTMVEVRVTGVSATAVGGVFSLGTTTAQCDVHTSDCAGTTTSSTCVRLGGSQDELGTGAGALRIASMIRTTTTLCRIENNAAGKSESSADIPFGNAQIQIMTNGDTSAVVQSVVIYGAR